MHRPAQVGQPQCEQETIGQHACGVPLLRHTALPGLLRDSFVLADHAAEDRSSLDPLTGQIDQGTVAPATRQNTRQSRRSDIIDHHPDTAAKHRIRPGQPP